MKKIMKYFVILFLLLVNLNIFANDLENLNFQNFDVQYYFHDNILEYKQDLYADSYIGPYTLREDNYVNYISFRDRTDIIQFNKYFAIINSNKYGPDRTITEFFFDKSIIFSHNFFNMFPLLSVVNASSFLIEGDTKYSYENLRDFELDTPWVEGVPGYGIGESISLSFKHYRFEDEIAKIKLLLIINGFISKEKPYLYNYNSRVKSFVIKNLQTESEQTIILEDNGKPQLFIVDDPGEELELIIKDVYPGTKWDDTCVHGIISFQDSVYEEIKEKVEIDIINNTY